MLRDVSGTLERFQVILDRVAVCSGDFDRIGYGNPTALAAQFQNLCRKFGQIAEEESGHGLRAAGTRAAPR